MIGYLDLAAGISGDMFLGCLVDAGWPIERLRATLTALKLPADDWAVDARPVQKGPLRATLVDVKVRDGHHHGHAHHPEPDLAQPPPCARPGEASALKGHHHHHHAHRNLHDVCAIIHASDLPDPVRRRAIAVFERLAHAEARVHGTTVDQIHFHEVGALDAIVDIVGTVAGLHELGVEQLFAGSVPLGGGWTTCEHGRIPLPAPATMALLSAVGAPTCAGPGDGELVTPTGAALVCELATFATPPMRLERVGTGAGQRDCAWPNVARLSLGQPDTAAAADPHAAVQIDTNIDDMNPQFYGPLMEKLLAAGAYDVWMVPIQMKKNRPGVTLSILASAAREVALADILLRETTTLGMRIHPVQKRGAEREMRSVATRFGDVPIKLKKWAGQTIGAQPEYEDCRRLADAHQVPVRVVYDAAMAAANQEFLHDTK
jgi:uncharacterized protein (TIGR00299 family) protein